MRFGLIGEPRDNFYKEINEYINKHCPKTKDQITKDKEKIAKVFKKFNIEVIFR